VAEIKPTRISVEMKPPLAVVKARFDDRIKALTDFSVPHKKMAIFLDQWVQRNFRTQGGKVGGWKPLAAGGRWKESSSGKRIFDANAKILQDTARLKFSFIPWASKKSTGIGSDVPYSEQHEKGLNGLPVRRMLPTQTEVNGDLNEIMADHVLGVIRASRGMFRV
jgi:phage gpG-like protein